MAPFITPGHIVGAKPGLLMAFVANLFTTHPGLSATSPAHARIENVLHQLLQDWDDLQPAMEVLGGGGPVAPSVGSGGGRRRSPRASLTRAANGSTRGRAGHTSVSPRASLATAAEQLAAEAASGRSSVSSDHSGHALQQPQAVHRYDENRLSFRVMMGLPTMMQHPSCADASGDTAAAAARMQVTPEMRAQAGGEIAHFDFTALGKGAHEDLLNLQMALPLVER